MKPASIPLGLLLVVVAWGGVLSRGTGVTAQGQPPVSVFAVVGSAAAAGGQGQTLTVRADTARLAQAAADGASVVVPLPTGEVVARLRTYETRLDGYLAAGEIVSGPAGQVVDGEAAFSVVNGILLGRIVHHDVLFLVRQSGAGTYQVARRDPDQSVIEAQPLVPPVSLTPGEMPAVVVGGDSGAFIDILVAYTPVARALMGGTSGIEAEVQGSIDIANLALANANVTTRYRLVHQVEVDYTMAGSSNTDLDRFTNPNDGYMDDVHRLRDVHRADVVSLLTTANDVGGLGWLLGAGANSVAGFQHYAFNMNRVQQILGDITLGHEIGHNIGLHHDRMNAGGGQGAFPYAFGHRVPDSLTVMAYRCIYNNPGFDCNNRRAIYSTPYRNYPTTVTPAGVADSEENARAIAGTLAAVSNFRDSTCAYTASASPTSFGSGGGTGTMTVTTTAGCAWTGVSSNRDAVTLAANPSKVGSSTHTFTVHPSITSRTTTLHAGGQTVTITQTGDEDAPAVSINDVSVTEGHAGTKTATFTVSLDRAGSVPATVAYATSDITATGVGSATTATSSGAVTIADSGPATPYPSTIAVSGLTGNLARVRVRLNTLTHTYPADLDVVLVGPGGQKVMLMSDAGGGTDLNGVTLTFQDGAVPLPATITTGTYAPTDLTPGETLPSPAPAGPYGTALSVFTGTNANGTWSLYVADDASVDAGTLASWSLITETSDDYVPASGTLSFPAGTTSLPLAITINGDIREEPTETFRITLSGLVSVQAGDLIGVGTIVDDDSIPVPGAPTMSAPTGSSANPQPTYVWGAVATATSYKLFVNDAQGTRINSAVVTAAAAGCAGGGTCSYTPAVSLVAGAATAWVRATNEGGDGPWSAGRGFMVTVPGTATPTSPLGAIVTRAPSFDWAAVPFASHYLLQVNDSVGVKVNRWYTAAEAGCAASATCSASPGATLALGSATWWVRTWSPAGYGAWSGGASFSMAIPSAPSITAPSGGTVASPLYRWAAVSGAAQYQLWVDDTSGNRIQQWFTAAQVGCASGTGTCEVSPAVVLATGAGAMWVRAWNALGTSAWSAVSHFTVMPVGVIDTYQVPGAMPGGTAQLWARVRNNTGAALSAGHAVWFRIRRPDGTTFSAGSTSVAGLAAGASAWYAFTWNVTGGDAASGGWSYDAKVWSGITERSAYSGARAFTVGRNSQFNGGTSVPWRSIGGNWEINSAQWLLGTGRLNNWQYVTMNTTTPNVATLDFSVRMWRDGCDVCANRVVVRGTSSGNTWTDGYTFQYLRDGRFLVFKTVNGVITVLQPWTVSAAIAKGNAWNLLRVVAHGTTLRFYINGVQVWSGTDSSHTAGEIGWGFHSDVASGNRLWVDYAVLSDPGLP